ncbi:pentatricopeptide repeat-containing protein At1g02370, mitochondrial-like isoform X1 [Chenopodium quinoa]|uniref:pentatricopeptide repeat-containing protein At1g02370, mitochondrial-like isoform X1 n=1 Tax=Chenopodium quinoa TaxID=63459 RepID=UPI000B78B8E7|nr:pentatricopeptide repeat-containing protein At1g02370, mitochondrial-like isoform X1 [Chenopodium quinoa]
MLQSLKHKLKLTTTITRLISGNYQLLRRLSTATSPIPSTKPPENRHYVSKHVLQKKLWAVLNTSQTVSDVLNHIIRNGEQFTSADLLACIQTLRKHGHYSQCLEILEWMDKGRFEYSATDYALRLRLMCNVKSIKGVEKYFDSIPSDAKNQYTYGALLYCYCTKMKTDKALAIFKKMDELKYIFNDMAFNSLMELYIKVGTPEKVPLLVKEMKQRNIPLTSLTYCIWIQCYRYAVDLVGLEQVMHEVQEQDSVRDDWKIYSNLAAVYIKVGTPEKVPLLVKEMKQRNIPLTSVTYCIWIQSYRYAVDLEDLEQVYA